MKLNELPRSKCENIKIDECKTLGYNATTPLDMYSDVARNLEYGKNYIKFVSRYACSKNALFFLCSVYSPICFENSPEPILPCRSLCEQVKRNCSRYIKLAYLHWPKELKCDSLPEYHNGFCVTPNAFTSNQNGEYSKLQLLLKINILKICSPTSIIIVYSVKNTLHEEKKISLTLIWVGFLGVRFEVGGYITTPA